ncbi:MAG: 4Fe-4S dicluster domain-containing protein, partial [Candidatus Eremiobacterota bacterium]
MAELYPLAMPLHLRRILHEHKNHQQIYDLPAAKFWRPQPGLDLSVRFHGMRASTALGPAAGPQDQLIQNILLSWLGGSRIIELKTVQILDELKISRPCIYAGNVGFNVEWSQELRLADSLHEYVASSMLVDVLKHLDVLGLGDQGPAATDTIFDLSVGYDLKGISSQPVRSFIEQTQDASPLVDKLRPELPPEFRDLPFRTDLVKSITLSTFHGCPKDEIERIVHFLLTEMNVSVIVKLNPTQLERGYLEHLLHEKMGYRHLTVNPKAYETSLSLEEAVGIVERLEPEAQKRGLGLGVKFSNTLEVLNRDAYFSDEVMYMSGPPLHVIAVTLVEEWRKRVGDRFPITFAAGIDRENFPDAMALGLTPITVCTDLLKTRGYARQVTYLEHLQEKMRKVGAGNLEDFTLKHRGQGLEVVGPVLESFQASHPDHDWGAVAAALTADLEAAAASDTLKALQEKLPPELAAAVRHKLSREAALRNTPLYAAEARENPRYTHAKNATAPKKIGSALYLFDCIACGKCVPVCPNDANFTYPVEPLEVEARNYKVLHGKVLPEEAFTLKVRKNEQWAVYADFCNECGNCDVYCPEDGGPFAQKPKFFGCKETFERHRDRDGFFVERSDGVDRMWGRVGGQ